MDMSKIRIIFGYEFSRETNATQTNRNYEGFGKDVTNERAVRRCFPKSI